MYFQVNCHIFYLLIFVTLSVFKFIFLSFILYYQSSFHGLFSWSVELFASSRFKSSPSPWSGSPCWRILLLYTSPSHSRNALSQFLSYVCLSACMSVIFPGRSAIKYGKVSTFPRQTHALAWSGLTLIQKPGLGVIDPYRALCTDRISIPGHISVVSPARCSWLLVMPTSQPLAASESAAELYQTNKLQATDLCSLYGHWLKEDLFVCVYWKKEKAAALCCKYSRAPTYGCL